MWVAVSTAIVVEKRPMIFRCNAKTSAKDGDGRCWFGLATTTSVFDSKAWASAWAHCKELLLFFCEGRIRT